MNALTVIVLTKNNLSDLLRSLRSIELFCINSKVIIFDGSDSSFADNDTVRSYLSSNTNLYSYYYRPEISGVYRSMNFSLTYVETEALLFLNSGDVFIASPKQALNTLLDYSLDGVFCSSRIINNGRLVYEYPYTGIKSIYTWLNFWSQLPIHQSIVFRTSWALNNPYPLNYPVSADAIIKKKLIKFHSFKFVPLCLVSFTLGGLSTSSLYLSSNEVCLLSLNKRLRLYIKFFLQNLFSGFPIISIIKNKLINFFCTFF